MTTSCNKFRLIEEKEGLVLKSVRAEHQKKEKISEAEIEQVLMEVESGTKV